MKVGLLECDHVLERFRHIAGDYRDMFATWLPKVEWRLFDARNGEFPTTVDVCDAYLTTGSRYSAYDDEAWIHTLKDFVRRLHAASKPFVGICFGHQILAEALGGKVEKAESGWGIGVHRVKIVLHEPWMRPELQVCGLQFMHQDQVVRLPEDSFVLGRTEHCPVAMFRVGRSMLGIQPHPEFVPAYTGALIRDRIKRIGEAEARTALDSLNLETDEDVIAKWVVEFLA
ncbi:MAG: glutamine amidotransferase-related protein [Blastocatellia bacterium]